ncbi:hypothetical protein J6590_037512 [Homalodisca vitripennis]|nr:hypothetical protein J6590_037512 [Homalodisca vitripennis]
MSACQYRTSDLCSQRSGCVVGRPADKTVRGTHDDWRRPGVWARILFTRSRNPDISLFASITPSTLPLRPASPPSPPSIHDSCSVTRVVLPLSLLEEASPVLSNSVVFSSSCIIAMGIPTLHQRTPETTQHARLRHVQRRQCVGRVMREGGGESVGVDEEVPVNERETIFRTEDRGRKEIVRSQLQVWICEPILNDQQQMSTGRAASLSVCLSARYLDDELAYTLKCGNAGVDSIPGAKQTGVRDRGESCGTKVMCCANSVYSWRPRGAQSLTQAPVME